MKKMLIAYYSWSNGNTERIAKELQSATGGDLVRINTVVPYSGKKYEKEKDFEHFIDCYDVSNSLFSKSQTGKADRTYRIFLCKGYLSAIYCVWRKCGKGTS